MAKKKVADIIKEIKKLIESKKVRIGTEIAIKNMKLGKVERVYLSSNCPAEVKKTIEYYGKLGNVEIVTLEYPNDELGVICKKPFSISVLSVLKV